MATASTQWWQRKQVLVEPSWISTAADFRLGTISIRMRRDDKLSNRRFNIFLSPSEARALGTQLLKHAETYEKGIVGIDAMCNVSIAE